MTDAAIQKELLEHTKLKPKANETTEAFTVRVIDKVNKMADVDDKSWGELTEPAQEWINLNVTAQSQGSELNLLSLDPVEDQETETEGGGSTTEETSTEERPVATKTRAKAKKPAKEVKAKPAPKAAVKKASVKAKAKPVKTAKNGAGRGRTPLHPDAGVIKVIAKENPHREGTIRHKAFAKVKPGMTVAEAVKAGCPAQQIWSMAHRGLIQVSTPR